MHHTLMGRHKSVAPGLCLSPQSDPLSIVVARGIFAMAEDLDSDSCGGTETLSCCTMYEDAVEDTDLDPEKMYRGEG
jgi:hypothetical protein